MDILDYSAGQEVTIVADVYLQDTTNLLKIITRPVDFVASGYALGAALSNPSLGTLLFTSQRIRDQVYAEITIGGVPTVAYRLPLTLDTVYSTLGTLKYNGPAERVITYNNTLIYQLPDGQDYLVDSWQELWR